MLTKNGNVILMNRPAESSVTVKCIDGTFVKRTTVGLAECFKTLTKPGTPSSNGNSCCIFEVGSGTTKETIYDYELENKLTNITKSSFSLTLESNSDLDENGWKLTTRKYTCVVTNNTSEDITVSEIGLYCYHVYYEGAYSTNLTALIYRKTFEPVTISPGDSYTFIINLG